MLRVESNADVAADPGRIAVSSIEYSDDPALRYEEEMNMTDSAALAVSDPLPRWLWVVRFGFL